MKEYLIYFAIILFTVFLATEVNAQKVKYKKGEVFIDKELAYIIIENERANKEENRTFKMIDAKDNIVFTLNDTTTYYKQMVHELKPRIAQQFSILNAPALNKAVEVPLIKGINYSSRINYLLKKTDLYNSQEFTEEVFNDFAEKLQVDKVNAMKERYIEVSSKRDSVNQKTIEYNGTLVEREPGFIVVSAGKVREGGKVLFTFKPYVQTEYTHLYHMFNTKDEIIGWFNLFQNGRENYDNVKLGVVEYGHIKNKPKAPATVHGQEMWFEIPHERTLPIPTTEDRIENITKHLSDIGAL